MCIDLRSSAMITHYRNQLILWDSLRKTSFGITIGVLGVFLLSKSNTDLLKYIYSSLDNYCGIDDLL